MAYRRPAPPELPPLMSPEPHRLLQSNSLQQYLKPSVIFPDLCVRMSVRRNRDRYLPGHGGL